MVSECRSNPVFIRYVDELLAWNRGMNLIGKSTVSEVWDRHIADSLRLLPFLEKNDCPTIIDIGSGGGLPAIPLSILLPGKKFILTEVDSKKIAFLEFVLKKLELNAAVADLNKPFLFEGPSCVTARAFSEIKNILAWIGKHTEAKMNRGIYLLKGKPETVKKELESAGPAQAITHELDTGCIVEIHF